MDEKSDYSFALSAAWVQGEQSSSACPWWDGDTVLWNAPGHPMYDGPRVHDTGCDYHYLPFVKHGPICLLPHFATAPISHSTRERNRRPDSSGKEGGEVWAVYLSRLQITLSLTHPLIPFSLLFSCFCLDQPLILLVDNNSSCAVTWPWAVAPPLQTLLRPSINPNLQGCLWENSARGS